MKLFHILPAASLVVSATTSSVLTVPLKRIRPTGSYLERVANADRARASAFRHRTDDQAYTVPARGISYAQYVINVGIGDPPVNYSLAVGTGSSLTFCGAHSPYVQTSTSIPTGENITVDYGQGSYFSGVEYLDQVTLAPNLVVANQSIGDALSSAGFPFADGVLGVGHIQGALAPDQNGTIPTIMNNLASQKLIEDQVLGIYFAPQTRDDDPNGALTFGGTDSSLYEGELIWFPVTKAFPARNSWGIDVASCTYGDFPVIQNPTPGIVDTGTTLIGLANDFFFAYRYGVPGAEVNDATGLLEIPDFAIASMQPLHFTMGGHVFTLDVNAQLFLPESNAPTVNKWYGTIFPIGRNSGSGFDFVLGMKFLERHLTWTMTVLDFPPRLTRFHHGQAKFHGVTFVIHGMLP